MTDKNEETGGIRYEVMAEVGTMVIDCSIGDAAKQLDLLQLFDQLGKVFMLTDLSWDAESKVAELRFTPGNGLAKVMKVPNVQKSVGQRFREYMKELGSRLADYDDVDHSKVEAKTMAYYKQLQEGPLEAAEWLKRAPAGLRMWLESDAFLEAVEGYVNALQGMSLADVVDYDKAKKHKEDVGQGTKDTLALLRAMHDALE